jgi:ParB-like chromosome segregation protein Spo0J
MSAAMLELTALVFDESIYPRQNTDDQNIRQMLHARDGGITLPPIVVDRKTKRIVDGVHRYHAALRHGDDKIAVAYKTYASEAELVKDAIMLNSGVGLRLGTDDTLKCIEIGNRVGLKELDLAGALRTSIAHLRAIAPRFATVEEAVEGVKKLRKVHLKGSVRHLAGVPITAKQEQAMLSAPGQSYLLTCRQLADALEHNLLPPRDKHPALWDALQRLQNVLNLALAEKELA